jgi:hypothetical protein
MLIKSQPNVSLFIPDMTISSNFMIFVSSNDNMDRKTIECFAFSFYRQIWRPIAPNENVEFQGSLEITSARVRKISSGEYRAKSIRQVLHILIEYLHSLSICIAVVKVRE